MRPYQRARFLRAVRSLLPAILALAASAGALGQTPLVSASHTVVTEGEPPAVEHDFEIANAGIYTVTVTDVGSKETPSAPLASVAMAVTQGTALAGTPTSVTAAGTPITLTAQAGTSYTLHVVGILGSQVGSGPIEEDVTDSSGNKVDSWIDTLSIPSSQQSGTTGVLTDTFSVNSSGTYTVSMTDLAFPQPLSTVANTAGLSVVDATSGQLVTVLTGPGSPQTAQLNQGDSYQIVAYGAEQAGAAGGLFSVEVAPAAGSPVYGPTIVSVGAVTLIQTSASGKPESSFTLPAATASTLELSDLSFPAVSLTALGAAVVDVSTQQVLGSPVAGTSQQNFTTQSASDRYEVFAYALADDTADQGGSYSLDIRQGSAFPFSEAEAVSSTGSTGTVQGFSYDVSAPATASYVFTLTDFKTPAQLGPCTGLEAVQDGERLGSVNSPGSFTASASQGQVTLLAFGEESQPGQPTQCAGGTTGQTSTTTPGLMGIDVSPSGGGASVFNLAEGIGAQSTSSSFSVQSAESMQANVVDLVFPAALQSLSAVVTSGTHVIGTLTTAGSPGSLPIQAAANTTYNITVLAQPAPAASGSQAEEAGTYAMSVDPSPTVTLSASSTSITSGSTVTLAWTSTNATSCTASGGSGWSGNETPASGGSVTTSALTATTSFSITCAGGGGSASASVTVTVGAASSGGHGGGGSIDPEMLLALAALLAVRSALKARPPGPPAG